VKIPDASEQEYLFAAATATAAKGAGVQWLPDGLSGPGKVESR